MRTHARVILAYTFLGLILTWPLVAHLTTHVPGDGIDDPSLAWNLWWVKHALVDLPQNPFQCAWQFWPVGINLAFYTLTVLNGLLSVPLQTAFGLIPAYNLLLLSSFILSGLGAYLLGLDLLARTKQPRWRHIAAFAGGILYAFASAKLFYAALGQGNIASSQWAPFAALYILRAARRKGRARDAGLAALFIVFQAYAELTYASFLLIFAALAFLWALAGAARQAGGKRQRPAAAIVARFALMGAIFAVGIAPVLANMLPDLRAEGDFFTAGGGFADVFSADLAGYLVPTQLHPFLGGIVRNWSGGSGFPVDKGQHIFLGYIAPVLAALGLWHGRRHSRTLFWALSAALFFLLTLGPSLRVAGTDTGIPLPFRIMEALPFFKGNRYPSRYSVMLLLSLAPLVAGGAAFLLERMARPRPHVVRFAAPALVALMLFEHLSAPLPVFDLRVPVLYEQVANEPGDFALLELPLGWRNGARVAGKQDILIMQQLWYQTAHGKRVLGGNTSRNPEFKFQYFSENPTLARLIALTNAADLSQHEALRAHLAATPVTEADRQLAGAWAAYTNIRYVMLHRDKAPASLETELRQLLPVSLVAEDGALALYSVEAGAPAQKFDLGSYPGRLALAEGWNPPPSPDTANPDRAAVPAYAQRKEVRLLLPLPAGALTVHARAASLAGLQQVRLVVNGRNSGVYPLDAAERTLSWHVPAGAARPPLSDVRLQFGALAPVAGLASGASQAFSVLVRSSGQETGDFARIYVDGVEQSLNRRGYNLVALDPNNGTVLAAETFDTHAHATASGHMREWISRQPPGTLITGAVRDEASQQLDPQGVDALRSLGLQADLRGRFRWGHAFLASKGGGGVSAQEQSGAILPAQVSLGLPLSGPEATAVVYSVEIDSGETATSLHPRGLGNYKGAVAPNVGRPARFVLR